METLSFTFGVLSVVGLLLVITIVAGAVKVLKQQKQIKELEQDTDQRTDDIHRRIDEVLNHVDKTYSESISYTDSRLDKLDQKLTSALSAKQILKG